MTNKEYFEKNNIPFAEAMKEYDVKKHGTFEQFLYSEHKFKHKFNVGDVVMYSNYDPCIVYDINDGKYNIIVHSYSGWYKDICNIKSFEKISYKIGHSDLQFAVKEGIIEDEDISREISEYE